MSRSDEKGAVFKFVMPGACPGHPRLSFLMQSKTWMAGTSPAMTLEKFARYSE
jgi:hypothetical protein